LKTTEKRPEQRECEFCEGVYKDVND